MTIGICIIIAAFLVCVARKLEFIIAFVFAACYLAKHIVFGVEDEYGNE
jgi:hypothetical protein